MQCLFLGPPCVTVGKETGGQRLYWHLHPQSSCPLVLLHFFLSRFFFPLFDFILISMPGSGELKPMSTRQGHKLLPLCQDQDAFSLAGQSRFLVTDSTNPKCLKGWSVFSLLTYSPCRKEREPSMDGLLYEFQNWLIAVCPVAGLGILTGSASPSLGNCSVLKHNEGLFP